MKTTLASLLLIAAVAVSSCGKPAASHSSPADGPAARTASEYYTCPMHPQIHSDKPGSCPICHMTLVKVSGSGAGQHADTAAITVDERGQQLANVATSVVGMEPVERTIRAFGVLEIPETNKAVISARFSGRIEKLYVSTIGAAVRKGQPLFDIYSPDIVQTENEYLQASAGSHLAIGGNAQAGPQGGTADARMPLTLQSAARSKLQLLGFTEEQIRELDASGKAALVFTYHSPASGVVVDKKIVEGVYVAEGLPLFEISDLSTLWNIADVYETDAALLHPGDKASIQLQNSPGAAVKGVIAFIYPVVNPQSRTIKVRLSLNNSSGALRPNAYTETVFRQGRGTALTVPATAVLITGKRNLVFVKASGNRFEPRDVGLGVRFNGKYEITSGLRQGDIVVSEGGYLIDSESQLKSGGGR